MFFATSIELCDAHSTSHRCMSSLHNDNVAHPTSSPCYNADSQARELHATMEGMKRAALELPGGHLTMGEIERLAEMLKQEADKRR